MNPKHDLKRVIKLTRENKKLDGFDYDPFNLISDLFDYVEILEVRIEKLEDGKI
jgi:hypothetical protein